MNALGVLILAAKPILQEETAGMEGVDIAVNDASEGEVEDLEDRLRTSIKKVGEKDADKFIKALLDQVYAHQIPDLVLDFPRDMVEKMIERVKTEMPLAFAAAAKHLDLQIENLPAQPLTDGNVCPTCHQAFRRETERR